MSCMAYRLLSHHADGGGGLWAGGLMAFDVSCSIRCRVGSGLLGEPGENVGKHFDGLGGRWREMSGSGEVVKSMVEVSPEVYLGMISDLIHNVIV